MGLKFKALSDWQDGLNELDVDKVRSALEAGVPAHHTVGGKHPLLMLIPYADVTSGLMESFSLLDAVISGTKKTDDATRRDAKFSEKDEILDLLLDHDLSVLTVDKQTGERFVDLAVKKSDTVFASKIVWAALKESLRAKAAQPYVMPLDAVLSTMPKPDAADTAAQTAAKRQSSIMTVKRLTEIHDHVRLMMSKPGWRDSGLFKKHATKLSFWTQDLQVPDQAAIDAIFPAPKVDAQNPATTVNDVLKRTLFSRGLLAKPAADPETSSTLKKEDPAEIMAEMDQYTGLETFKESMLSLMMRVAFDKARKVNNMKTDDQNYHTAFLGNPGTGKTTSSRLKARMLHSLDLTGPRYNETSRATIIDKYVGHTEDKVRELIQNSDILFIDEAYALVDNNGSRHDYGFRALDTLVAAMGNRKDSFTLFVAGYSEPMKRFIEANEGLSSRLKIFETLRDFTVDELGRIMDKNLAAQGYELTADAREYLAMGIGFEKQNRGEKHFGNARVVVSLVQDLPNHMALRLSREFNDTMDNANAADLSRVTVDDIRAALERRGVTLPILEMGTTPQAAPSKPGPWAKPGP